MVRVILFEDNRNFREALELFFEDSEKVYLTKSFEDATKAVAQIKEYQPDVVLMDIEMPGISGLDAMKLIKAECPNTKVMIQTQFEDDHRLFVALCRGAWGYALKSDSLDRIETAILDVHQGGGYFSPAIAGKVARFFQEKELKADPDFCNLTTRELEVLKHLVNGKRYQEIANAMFISYEGVHSHVKKVYEKLHVNSKSEAIVKAIDAKLTNKNHKYGKGLNF
ncbi:MAG: response regulator transcription factor [Haliscomenobacter sp.]|nr:response regulator transcription factor [Haliscomenobacter sp.]MBK9491228.1 response regulator transcription factor [Haliscomenobacter sp.]